VTTPYSPETATALAIGATTAGYVDASGVTWDDDIATWNLRSIGERAGILALDQRDNLAALRRDLGIPPVGNVRIMCVGDSITVGAGATDGLGYRPWLTDMLARRHITSTLTVVAEGGQTMRVMAPRALAALPTAQPDIVLIAIGTNDAVQPDMTDFAGRLGTFVDQILASSPTVKVAVARISLSRIAWMATAQGPVNAAVDSVVAARHSGGRVASADLTVVTERWTADGIHPLDAGYCRIAQQWLASIDSWLPSA
jgi:lysophospholipase L1-like esterase